MSGLKIPKFKHMSIKKLSKCLKPEKVYIPLKIWNNYDVESKVKKGDYVYKGQIVGKGKDEFKTPVFSSVSGIILDFEEVTYKNGGKVKAIVIENDFKETLNKKYELRKKINKLSKDEFIKIIEECGIVGMSGESFPTFMKYKTDKKINTLIINVVESEPYITSDSTVFLEKCEDILETIDDILDINDIDEAIIAVKGTNIELINKLNKYLGTYLRIKIYEVPDVYPMGWERTLIKEIKKVEYDSFPIEKGIVVNNAATIYAINQALKFEKPIIERIITFTGDGIKKPQNVLVKMGTKIEDIIKEIGGVYKNTIIIANGPMMGKLVDNNLVVTPNLSCVLILKEAKEIPTKECIRCGKCVEVCPADLCPVLIKDNLKKIKNLKKLRPDLCSECGLCTYICPSKLDVRSYVEKAKIEIKGDK